MEEEQKPVNLIKIFGVVLAVVLLVSGMFMVFYLPSPIQTQTKTEPEPTPTWNGKIPIGPDTCSYFPNTSECDASLQIKGICNYYKMNDSTCPYEMGFKIENISNKLVVTECEFRNSTTICEVPTLEKIVAKVI